MIRSFVWEYPARVEEWFGGREVRLTIDVGFRLTWTGTATLIFQDVSAERDAELAILMREKFPSGTAVTLRSFRLNASGDPLVDFKKVDDSGDTSWASTWLERLNANWRSSV